ncbi:hypothetical protein [Aeromicrobium sp.]|uniref:hypothetical protein n=1 Tax=Aeromicrobium sp. TaxID=1871063 RepID=UPI0019AF2E1A|nr:hypothetical protein [Aeromicrobium sp.]MBC7632031.1 hypothetical protein [Aeromicrobium sp.]
MSTHTLAPRSKPSRLLVFAPTLLILGVIAFVASGASVVPGASAVTAIGVTGTVSSTFTVDPTATGGTGATGCADESLGATFQSTAAYSNGCRISFTANAANGVTITFDNNNAAANDANGFFCVDPDGAGVAPRDCGAAGATANRVANVTGTSQTLASDKFGLALTAVGGDGGVAAGAGAPTVNAAPTSASAAWNQIGTNGAGTTLCTTTGPNTTGSNCDFVFGGLGKGAVQAAGSYGGSLRLVTSTN